MPTAQGRMPKDGGGRGGGHAGAAVGFAERAGEAGEEAGGVGAAEFVWPDAADAPAHGAQGAGDEAVAGAVGGIFFLQKAAFVFGDVAWRGQPGQKQPSTKTARRCGRKTKSGFTRKEQADPGEAGPRSVAPRRQPVMPCVRKTAMRRSSVAAWPRERRADITAERFRRMKMSVTDRVVGRDVFPGPDSIAFPGVLRPHDGEDLARAFALIRVGQETDLVFEVAGFDQTVGEHGRDENDVLFPGRDQFRAREVERMEAEWSTTICFRP